MTTRLGVIYKSSEVANRFQIKDSVFKKYVYLLEKEGYVFQKNQQGHRLFSEEDIKSLEMLMEMSSYDGVTLEMAAKKICSTKGHDSIPVKVEEHHDVMTLMTKLLEEQRALIEKQTKDQEQQFAIKMQEILEQKLEEQEKRLLAKLDIQEHSKLLGQAIEELRDFKQTISTDSESNRFTFKGWLKSLWKQ